MDIKELIEKILESGVKMSDNKYRFNKIDYELYIISENQGGGKYKIIEQFSDLVIALSRYSELVTEI